MHPSMLFNWGPEQSWSMPSYHLFFWLACLAVLIISGLRIRQKKLLLLRSWLLLLSMTAAVPVGARLLHIISNPQLYQEDPTRMWSLHLTGFSLMGGMLLAALTGLILARILRYDPWPLADAIAPGLGLGIVLIRMGCFLNGCCFGQVTDLPWAVHFPVNSVPYKYYIPDMLASPSSLLFGLIRSPGIHPTQLYEAGAALLITLFIVFLERKRVPSGIPFLTFALLFSLFRWGNSFLRAPALTLQMPGMVYPLIYLSIIIVSGILIFWRLQTRHGFFDIPAGIRGPGKNM